MKTHTFNGVRVDLEIESGIDGYVTHEDPKEVYVDPRLRSKAHLETAIHESLHVCFPAASEDLVQRCGRDIARFLWRLGYRRKP